MHFQLHLLLQILLYFLATPTYVVQVEQKTHAEAIKVCKSLGRQLFEPTQSSANIKVTALAKAKGVTSFWIGIHDKANEGQFTYESNGQTIGYKNWRPNKPNNSGKSEDCAHMYHGKWNDLRCNYKLSFVCEKPPPGN